MSTSKRKVRRYLFPELGSNLDDGINWGTVGRPSGIVPKQKLWGRLVLVLLLVGVLVLVLIVVLVLVLMLVLVVVLVLVR